MPAVPPLRPIGHEERLSIVEHLDELRNRLIWCLLAFVVAFGLTYWQNEAVLDIANRPVDQAQEVRTDQRSQDPLEQSALFERRVGEMARALGPALQAIGEEVEDPVRRQAIAEAVRAVRGAAAAMPAESGRRPITLGVTEPFLTTFKVAGYAALLLVLPVLLYQLYAFVLPAFTPRERRAVLPLLMAVPLLFIAGATFGYFVVLPSATDFLLNFNDDEFDILLRAQDYYSFAVVFLAAIGLMFQIPIAVLALTRLEIVSVRQLRSNRGYALLVIAVVAALVTPTPDPITMLLSMLPLVVLFELSILLAAALERRRAAAEPDLP